MKELKIKLSTIADVRDFISAVTAFCGSVDLISGRYTVDGKSVMGIFSLDLLSPITVRITENKSEGGDEAALAAELAKRFGA